MPLWVIVTLAGVLIGIAALCWAACVVSGTVDDYELEHERQVW